VMKDYIIKHIRDKKGNPYATLVGYCENGCVFIGDAKCNKKFDTFKKNRGVQIALNRAKKYSNFYNRGKYITFFNRNELLDNEIINFSRRCKKYFKSDQIFYSSRSKFGVLFNIEVD
ncbi:MAG: hypothetical protein ACOCZ5_03030, partial [bacterium]